MPVGNTTEEQGQLRHVIMQFGLKVRVIARVGPVEVDRFLITADFECLNLIHDSIDLGPRVIVIGLL